MVEIPSDFIGDFKVGDNLISKQSGYGVSKEEAIAVWNNRLATVAGSLFCPASDAVAKVKNQVWVHLNQVRATCLKQAEEFQQVISRCCDGIAQLEAAGELINKGH